jgi:hypothetical protein
MPNAYQQDYERISRDIEQATKKLKPDTAILAIMCAASVLVTGVEVGPTGGLDVAIAGAAGAAVQPLYAFLKGKATGAPPVVPNPWFVWNGHGDAADNANSIAYLKSRRWKGVGGAALSVAGAVASVHTAGVNVGAAVVHGNATASTAAHMLQLVAIAKSYKQSQTIASWIDLVMTMKTIKATLRGGQLLGSVIPGASVPVNIAAAVARTGAKLTMTNVCFCTAAAIHWRAYQEQAISANIVRRAGGAGGTGKIGPASRIYWEIFTRRGLTRVFGAYDIAGLIREAGGWQPLADKLLLL